MLSDVLGFIRDIFKPASDIIDELNTSEEEKLKLRNELVRLQNQVTEKQLELMSKQIDLDRQVIESQTKMMIAESQSDSWLAKNWRPITMLTFLGLIVLYSLGWIQLQEYFAKEFMLLVQIGLGGYVIGRSAEKALPAIAKSISKK